LGYAILRSFDLINTPDNFPHPSPQTAASSLSLSQSP
jgi:hypothetical protein